jgi:precorrin-8X/cobalt-precorrin-8 methylmutase
MTSEALARLEHVLPQDIESRSFQIIAAELAERGIALDPKTAPLVMRAIHTTADFDYAENLRFSTGAVEAGVKALREGACVVTDTTMAQSGINKRALARLGGEALNFIRDSQVMEQAKQRGLTRSAMAMEKAADLGKPLIYAVGNAPTALVRLWELINEGMAVPPALIIGVPVGFVNVVESKDLVMTLPDTPWIVAQGRKGGSNLAAALINALLYMATGNQRE